MRDSVTVRRVLAAISALGAIGLSSPVHAEMCHSHSIVTNPGVRTQGGYFWMNNPDIQSGWDDFHTYRQLLKTMWVGMQYGNWIELGFTDGHFNPGGDYHGVYYARTYPTYREFQLPQFLATPGHDHSYEVQFVGNGTWRVYVDFQAAGDVIYPYGVGNGVDVGFESGAEVVEEPRGRYKAFYYNSPTNSYQEFLDANTGRWTPWYSGRVAYDDTGCGNLYLMPDVYLGSSPATATYVRP